MDITRDIHPLNEFKRNSKSMIEKITKERAPQVLTINGKPSVVVMDVETYQSVRDRIETIAALRRGFEEIKNGEGQDVDTVFDEITKRT